MEFGKNLKKLFAAGLFTGAALTGLSKESKTAEDIATTLNGTISFHAPEAKINVVASDTEKVKTPKQEFEAAQVNLLETQMEFKGTIAELQKKFAYDPTISQHLAEIADASEKATVFAQGFMKDRMDQLDSAKTEEYKADAIDFAHSDRSMFAKEFSSMQTLGTETMLGGLVAQEGFDVGKEVPTGPGVIQKTETAKAFLVGQNNILERLIATNIDFIAKKAAMDNINNANSTFDQAPLAQKDLDALHAVSFAQAQEISNSGSDQIAQK